MTRALIVSGDDLGLHEAINRGVIEGHVAGIITSASLVACGQAFDHACELAARHPTLDLGIHLTLVEERPVLGPQVLKSLASEGVLPGSYRQLFLELMAGRIEMRDIELELEAQILRVLKTGLPVSHLDSHQHTHFFPGLQATFLRLARRHGIPGLRASTRVTPRGTKFSLLLAPLSRGITRQALAQGIKTPHTLWLPGTSGRVTAAELVEGIPRLPSGVTELVVHPGVDQEALDRAYPAWRFDWKGELRAVQSAEVRAALSREGIQLTRYSELP